MAVPLSKKIYYKYGGITDEITMYSDGSIISILAEDYKIAGTYTFIPEVTGIYDILIYGASGGGGGGCLYGSHRASGGDGGKGYFLKLTEELIKGKIYKIVVGAKGLAGKQFDNSSWSGSFPYYETASDFYSTNGTSGGLSSFDNVVVDGGSGGNKGYYTITWDQEDGYDITSHWGSNIVPKDGNGLAGGLGTNVDYESYEKPNPIPDSRSVKDGLDGKIIISLRKGVPIKIGSTSGYLAITETYNTKSSRMHYKKADGTVCYVAKTV